VDYNVEGVLGRTVI